jgi:hypothetical protein
VKALDGQWKDLDVNSLAPPTGFQPSPPFPAAFATTLTIGTIWRPKSASRRNARKWTALGGKMKLFSALSPEVEMDAIAMLSSRETPTLDACARMVRAVGAYKGKI